ncbi:MAG: hypothetical protein WBG46_05230 [Nonlabens sp.]
MIRLKSLCWQNKENGKKRKTLNESVARIYEPRILASQTNE